MRSALLIVSPLRRRRSAKSSPSDSPAARARVFCEVSSGSSSIDPEMRVRDILPVWRLERFIEHRRNRRTRFFTEEMLRYNIEAAQRHGVEAACHPQDFIYEFVVRHMSFSSIKQAVDYYFDDGARSAEKFRAIVRDLMFPEHRLHILEFASGYGCVTRHLKKNQAWSLVACDIHSEAVEFLRSKLG